MIEFRALNVINEIFKSLWFQNSQEISSTTVVFSDASLQLLPEFKRDLSNAAVQSVENFDFKNYEKINEFIKNATDGLIQNLVGPGTLPIDTVLAVINGVHFDVRNYLDSQ